MTNIDNAIESLESVKKVLKHLRKLHKGDIVTLSNVSTIKMCVDDAIDNLENLSLSDLDEELAKFP